ncbi:o-linked N-acetyl glucosamine transferase-like protein [Daphnia magna]|uniref:O-linked N-acetyl glucosamine transferase-like protein n=1 Tax=Daphnia magna TaxID=35525 RepID=A0A162BUR5_9CRUS|nr:o-linked N-acetyl glucosamine transferase-like protein [Daphnia magna]
MKSIHIPNMTLTAKNDIDLDNIKQEINHLRSQILLLKNHQPPEQTEAGLTTLETTVETIKKQIAPLVNLPEKVNNLQKNMDSGFEATHNQLETLMNLVKESLTLNNNDRPPPKPPHTIDHRATTTTNKK